MNDGAGGMKPLESFDECEDYLRSRNARLFRKQGPNDVELSELVVHLPETLCVEDPDHVSYVVDDEGEQVISRVTGEPLTKPRLIPRDIDEARRYFDDALNTLVEIGRISSRDALHLRSDQYGESRPHMQLIFDNYAHDPNAKNQARKPGCLRTEASRVWHSHRDVTYEPGVVRLGKRYRQIGDPPGLEFSADEAADLARLAGKPYDEITAADLAKLDGERIGKKRDKLNVLDGKTTTGEYKLQSAQGQMRARMAAHGWPVELDIDREREGSNLGKLEAAQADNDRIIAEDALRAAEAESKRSAREVTAAVNSAAAELDAREAGLKKREAGLSRRETALSAREDEADDLAVAAEATRREIAAQERHLTELRAEIGNSEAEVEKLKRVREQQRRDAERRRREAEDEAAKITATAEAEAKFFVDRTRQTLIDALKLHTGLAEAPAYAEHYMSGLKRSDGSTVLDGYRKHVEEKQRVISEMQVKSSVKQPRGGDRQLGKW
ncbi:hypothetical protein ACXR2W_02340 [Leucobacter sp. HY1908]